MSSHDISLQRIIDEYRLSDIQSEAEVRTKLVVPLLQCLGYRDYLRGEEFPVYSWQGRKKNPPTFVDFLLFSDGGFAEHKDGSAGSLNWVKDHSLLVVEAKNPGEMPEYEGQAIFYSHWTKAIAYLVTDGEIIKGFYYMTSCADNCLLNCIIDDLPKEDLTPFSFRTIMAMKTEAQIKKRDYYILDGTKTIYSGKYCGVIADSNGTIPEEASEIIANLVGMNPQNNYRSTYIINSFLRTTDNIVDSDLRYNIPPIAQFLVRNSCNAKLHINSSLLPIFTGTLEHYYWDLIDRYCFVNDYLYIEFQYADNKPVYLGFDYSVAYSNAKDRLPILKDIKKCLDATLLMIVSENGEVLSFPLDNMSLDGKDIIEKRELTDYFIKGISEIIKVEDTFDIQFDLEVIDDEIDYVQLYKDVEIIYNGILGEHNSDIPFPRDAWPEDQVIIEIDEPVFFDTDYIPLPDIIIGDYCFTPNKVMILPNTYRKSNIADKLCWMEASCSFAVKPNQTSKEGDS